MNKSLRPHVLVCGRDNASYAIVEKLVSAHVTVSHMPRLPFEVLPHKQRGDDTNEETSEEKTTSIGTPTIEGIINAGHSAKKRVLKRMNSSFNALKKAKGKFLEDSLQTASHGEGKTEEAAGNEDPAINPNTLVSIQDLSDAVSTNGYLTGVFCCFSMRKILSSVGNQALSGILHEAGEDEMPANFRPFICFPRPFSDIDAYLYGCNFSTWRVCFLNPMVSPSFDSSDLDLLASEHSPTGMLKRSFVPLKTCGIEINWHEVSDPGIPKAILEDPVTFIPFELATTLDDSANSLELFSTANKACLELGSTMPVLGHEELKLMKQRLLELRKQYPSSATESCLRVLQRESEIRPGEKDACKELLDAAMEKVRVIKHPSKSLLQA